jgi:hypothetical protein
MKADAPDAEKFALRFGDWVVFNTDSWRPAGWITLNAVYVPTRSGIRRRSFTLAWNGERFSASGESDRLIRFDMTAMPKLADFLRRTLPAPAASQPKRSSDVCRA